MKKIVKRIAAMGAAVMMMSSMAIGASAYEAIKYGRAVGGSGSNAYISCFVTGIRTNSTVAGQAWTRTSSNNNNVYNPNFMQVPLLVVLVVDHLTLTQVKLSIRLG